MDDTKRAYLLFSINDRLFGIPATNIFHVLRAVALTPVPDSPRELMGVLNFHGMPIPVFDARLIMGLAPRDIRVSDRIVLMKTHGAKAGLVADDVIAIAYLNPDEIIPKDKIGHVLSKKFEGIVTLDKEIVLACNIDNMIPEELLDKALGSIQKNK